MEGNKETKLKVINIFNVVKSCKKSKSKRPTNPNDRLDPIFEMLLEMEDSKNPFVSKESLEAIIDPFDKYSENNLEKKAAIDLVNAKKKENLKEY